MEEAVIVIPTINNLQYLSKCIQSIKCSFPYELLVVDNGSVDGTLEWLKENGISFIHHENNFGCSYANNEAMDYAFLKDKLLFVIHNDILLHKDCLNNLYRGITETDFDLLYALEHLTGNVNPDVMKEFRYKYIYDKNNNGLPEEEAIGYVGAAAANGINFTVRVIRKTTLEKIGYFDVNFYPAYFEDNDYGLRCILGGVKFGIVNSARYYHFWSRSIHEGGVGELNSRYFGANRQYYTGKWGGSVGKETIKDKNIVLFRTREEDYELIKGKIV
jgi:GT2 family glycosyltransferase